MIYQVENSKILNNLVELDSVQNPSLGDSFFVLDIGLPYVFSSIGKIEGRKLEKWEADEKAVIHEEVDTLSAGYTDLTTYYENGFFKQKALIYKYLPTDLDPKSYDFTLLGLNQLNWVIKKGRREERLYLDEASKIVVRDKYIYVESTNGVKSYDRIIEWLFADGTVAFSKTVKTDSAVGSVTKLNRYIRQNQIDFLLDSGDGLRAQAELVPEPTKSQLIFVADSIDTLMKHYEYEVDYYIKRGGTGFSDAVNNETDSNILALLGIVVPKNDGSGEYWTVKDSILGQITLT